MPNPAKAPASSRATVSSTRPIVVGTDFSKTANHALRRATQLAADAALPLTIVHSLANVGAIATTPLMNTWLGQQASSVAPKSAALDAGAALAERELDSLKVPEGLQAERVVRTGSPFEALLSVAHSKRAQLVVVGVHSPKSLVEKYVLGSTAERVLRAGRCPVLVVRSAKASPYKRVLVAVDFSSVSLLLCTTVKSLVPDASIVLSTVLQPASGREISAKDIAIAERALAKVAEAAKLDRSRVSFAVEAGDPREGILTLVGERRPDLLALGTHGRRGVQRLLLGSVAEHVVRAVPVDVLVVPPAVR